MVTTRQTRPSGDGEVLHFKETPEERRARIAAAAEASGFDLDPDQAATIAAAIAH